MILDPYTTTLAFIYFPHHSHSFTYHPLPSSSSYPSSSSSSSSSCCCCCCSSSSFIPPHYFQLSSTKNAKVCFNHLHSFNAISASHFSQPPHHQIYHYPRGSASGPSSAYNQNKNARSVHLVSWPSLPHHSSSLTQLFARKKADSDPKTDPTDTVAKASKAKTSKPSSTKKKNDNSDLDVKPTAVKKEKPPSKITEKEATATVAPASTATSSSDEEKSSSTKTKTATKKTSTSKKSYTTTKSKLPTPAKDDETTDTTDTKTKTQKSKASSTSSTTKSPTDTEESPPKTTAKRRATTTSKSSKATKLSKATKSSVTDASDADPALFDLKSPLKTTAKSSAKKKSLSAEEPELEKPPKTTKKASASTKLTKETSNPSATESIYSPSEAEFSDTDAPLDQTKTSRRGSGGRKSKVDTINDASLTSKKVRPKKAGTGGGGGDSGLTDLDDPFADFTRFDADDNESTEKQISPIGNSSSSSPFLADTSSNNDEDQLEILLRKVLDETDDYEERRDPASDSYLPKSNHNKSKKKQNSRAKKGTASYLGKNGMSEEDFQELFNDTFNTSDMDEPLFNQDKSDAVANSNVDSLDANLIGSDDDPITSGDVDPVADLEAFYKTLHDDNEDDFEKYIGNQLSKNDNSSSKSSGYSDFADASDYMSDVWNSSQSRGRRGRGRLDRNRGQDRQRGGRGGRGVPGYSRYNQGDNFQSDNYSRNSQPRDGVSDFGDGDGYPDQYSRGGRSQWQPRTQGGRGSFQSTRGRMGSFNSADEDTDYFNSSNGNSNNNNNNNNDNNNSNNYDGRSFQRRQQSSWQGGFNGSGDDWNNRRRFDDRDNFYDDGNFGRGGGRRQQGYRQNQEGDDFSVSGSNTKFSNNRDPGFHEDRSFSYNNSRWQGNGEGNESNGRSKTSRGSSRKGNVTDEDDLISSFLSLDDENFNKDEFRKSDTFDIDDLDIDEPTDKKQGKNRNIHSQDFFNDDGIETNGVSSKKQENGDEDFVEAETDGEEVEMGFDAGDIASIPTKNGTSKKKIIKKKELLPKVGNDVTQRYNRRLQMLMDEEKYKEAMTVCTDMMKDRDFEPDDESQRLFIGLFSSLGQFNKSFNAFKAIESPTLEAYEAFIVACAKNSKGQEAIYAIKKMKDDEMDINVDICNHVIEALMQSKKSEMDVLGFYMQMMSVYEISANERTYILLMQWFAQEKKVVDALEVLHLMKKKNMKLSREAILAVLNACAESGRDDLALRVFHIVKENGITPDNSMYLALIRTFCNAGQVRRAEKYFSMPTFRRSLESYSAMIDGYSSRGRVSKAQYLLFDMRKDGFMPSKENFVSLFKGCVLVRDGIKAMRIMDDAKRANIYITDEMNVLILKALVGEDKYRSLDYNLFDLFDELRDQGHGFSEDQMTALLDFDEYHRARVK